MKKIMFNDKYGLTQAVLDGRKTQTRRIVTDRLFQECRSNGFIDAGGFNDEWETKSIEILVKNSSYKIGEVVAVAQSYKDCLSSSWIKYIHDVDPTVSYDRELSLSPGHNNKMFVRADIMPYRVKITNVRVERLQDISDEDCLKEGFEKINVNDGVGNMLSHWEFLLTYEDKLGRSLQLGSRDYKEAFGILIDKTCGIGTWDSNPWVFVYDFELTK